jgi:hypothetical protein
MHPSDYNSPRSSTRGHMRPSSSIEHSNNPVEGMHYYIKSTKFMQNQLISYVPI